jgi:hypothetical protein
MLILTTGTLLTAAPVRSSENAVFTGRVFQPDGVSPRTGVVVALYDDDSGEIFRSPPTDDEGTFRVDSAPAGSYRVVTETTEGVFATDGELTLGEGANRPLALTLTSTPPATPLAPAAETSGTKTGPSKTVKWLIAGGIIATTLFVFHEMTVDKEETSSDF